MIEKRLFGCFALFEYWTYWDCYFESDEVKGLKQSFEEKLAERDKQTKPLMWPVKVVNSDPELAEQFKKSAIKNNIK